MNNKGADQTVSAPLLFACGINRFSHDMAHFIFIVINPPVCNLDLSTSGAIATPQLNTPAIPPANKVLVTLSSLRLKVK